MANSVMSAIYEHIPHPHIATRKAVGPSKTIDQVPLNHPKLMVRVNSRVGLGITMVVGTMWCAYIFTAIALVSAPSAFASANALIIIAWIAQTFLQLVLLPVIIVGQNIQAKAADKRAEDTFNDADAVLHEALAIQKHLEAQDEVMGKLLSQIEALTVAAR